MSKDVSIQAGLPFLFRRVSATPRLSRWSRGASSWLGAGCVFSPTAAARQRCEAAILWQLGLVVYCSCPSSQTAGKCPPLIDNDQKLQRTSTDTCIDLHRAEENIYFFLQRLLFVTPRQCCALIHKVLLIESGRFCFCCVCCGQYRLSVAQKRSFHFPRDCET